MLSDSHKLSFFSSLSLSLCLSLCLSLFFSLSLSLSLSHSISAASVRRIIINFLIKLSTDITASSPLPKHAKTIYRIKLMAIQFMAVHGLCFLVTTFPHFLLLFNAYKFFLSRPQTILFWSGLVEFCSILGKCSFRKLPVCLLSFEATQRRFGTPASRPALINLVVCLRELFAIIISHRSGPVRRCKLFKQLLGRIYIKHYWHSFALKTFFH